MSSCPLLRSLIGQPDLSPGASYLVAVSGGVDSVSLLHALLQAGFRQLTVCHLHHGLRGPQADRDAALVGRLADQYQLPFELERQPVDQLARQWRCSIETAGRYARHRMLARLARQLDCPRALLAHHADDQAETILMNQFRGSASLGRCAMSPHQTLTVDLGNQAVDLILLRPLLALRKWALIEFAEAERLEFHPDASNRSEQFLRNRIRNRLMPELQHVFERDPVPTLLRLSDLARQDERYLDQLADQEFDRHTVPPIAGEDPPILNADPLRDCPLPIQRRVIHRWLRHHAIDGADADTIARVLTLLEPDPRNGHPARINLPGDRQAGRTGGRLWVR